jgi:hypothetical protein
MNGPTGLPTEQVPLPAAGEPKPTKPDAPPAGGEPVAAVPPAPKPRWVGEAVRDLLRVSRKKLLVLSTAGSVVAVGLALNALFTDTGRGPADAGKETASTSTEPPAVAAAHPAEPTAPAVRESIPMPPPARQAESGLVVVAQPPAVTPSPTPVSAPLVIPEAPVAVAPTLPPPAFAPGTPPPVLEPVPDPAMFRVLGLVPYPPSLADPIPAVPDPNGRFARGPDPTPPPPAVLQGPVIQVGASEPAKPASGGIELPPVVLPGTGGQAAPMSVPAPKLLPVAPAEPPKPAPSGPPAPVLPDIPPPVVPVTGPANPAKADPPAPFRPLPLDPPQTAPPPRPAADPKANRPADGNLILTKPAGGPDVRPASNQEPPRTDFDVDLHEPKAGDTYESISKLHYGDAKYAEALRAYNGGLVLGRGGAVQVPPMYVLRKRYPQLIPGQRSAPAADPARGPDWGPAPGKSDSYAVPRAGMTLKDVAAEVYGDGRDWKKLWDVNPRLDPNAELPAGTKLQLPPDARPKK